MINTTKGNEMNTKLNYFTNRLQAFEQVGTVRFEGTVTTESPKLVLEGTTIRTEGTKQTNYIGRFVFDMIGNLYFAAPRKKNFIPVVGDVTSIMISKVSA